MKRIHHPTHTSEVRDVNWLRSFDFDDLLMLAHLGEGATISETGKALGLTQSAISHRLRKVESIFAIKVCTGIRGAKAELTEDGKRLARHASAVIDLVEGSFGILVRMRTQVRQDSRETTQ